MVVSDKKETGFGMIGDIADNAAKVGGNIDPAERHEMVDVINNDEGGLEPLNQILDAAVEGVKVVSLLAESVKAD